MRGRINKNNISKRNLLEKLNYEGKEYYNDIDKILTFKKPKVYKIDPKFSEKKNINEEEKDNKAYNEALQIIQKFNNKFENNIKSYHSKKDENNNFIKGYKKYKKINAKMYVKEIEQKNYVFGHLINLYSKKGIKIPHTFFYNDVYKQSGLLLTKRINMDEFFEQEVNTKSRKSRKGAKSISFLERLSNEVGKTFKQRILSLRKNNCNNDFGNIASLSYDNNDCQKKKKIKPRVKMSKQDYFFFFDQLNSKINEIERQEKENNRLRQLISFEEKKHFLKHNRNNNITNNSINESYNFSKYSKNRSNINNFGLISQGENKTVDTFINNKKNISPNNSNYYNNKLCTSSTLVPKNNSLFNTGEDTEKENMLNKNISNLVLLDLNNNILKSEEKIKTKRVLKNVKFNNSHINISHRNTESDPENLRISMRMPNKRRNSTIIINPFKKKQIPSLLFNGTKNRRKTFLPNLNFSLIKTTYNKNDKNKEKIDLSKKNPMPKNNSQPNIINKKKTINQIYEQVNKINLRPYHKLKNKETLNNLYKNLYGDKINEFDSKKNHKDILTNYYNLKNKIIGSEQKKDIYSKYKELLPDIMIKKIKVSKELNETLKENPLNYAKALYNKNYNDFVDKND